MNDLNDTKMQEQIKQIIKWSDECFIPAVQKTIDILVPVIQETIDATGIKTWNG